MRSLGPEIRFFLLLFRGWSVLPMSTYTWGLSRQKVAFQWDGAITHLLEIHWIGCWSCMEDQLVQGLWYISPTGYLIPRKTRATTHKNLSSLCRRGETFRKALFFFSFPWTYFSFLALLCCFLPRWLIDHSPNGVNSWWSSWPCRNWSWEPLVPRKTPPYLSRWGLLAVVELRANHDPMDSTILIQDPSTLYLISL